MEKDKVLEMASFMFLQGAGRKQVIEFFAEHGISGDEAETAATDAYLKIKDQRKELLEATEQANKKQARNEGMKEIGIGILMILGSGAVLLATGRLFYIVLVMGFISLIVGLAKMFS